MFRWLNLLLLLCLIHYIGTSAEHVTGIKGGSVTLSCELEELEDHEITDIGLSKQSKHILDCQNEQCKSEDGRVFKEGSCDVIIKDLIFSDAGTYILRVHYKNTQTQVKYHLHIHDEISVKTGEKVKLHVLLINADKVEHQNINSTEWTELWTRGEEVQNDRLNISEETLIINKFTFNDTGIYRVLDSNNEILITVTVTVTESGTQSKGKDNGTEQHTVDPWIIVVSVLGALLVLALICAVIYWCWCRNTGHERVPQNDTEPRPI